MFHTKFVTGLFVFVTTCHLLGVNAAFTSPLYLDLTGNVKGIQLNGKAVNNMAGYAAAGAGDFNNDGFDDIIIGSEVAGGECYLVFGKTDFGTSVLELSQLDGTNGIVLTGMGTGIVASGAGDFNGDGFDDILLGAAYYDGVRGVDSGRTYLVFGRNSSLNTPALAMSSLDGSNGIWFDGVDPNERSGTSVSGAGDFNGDGFDDVLIGANGATPAGVDSGRTYLVFGGASFNQGAFALNTLNGNNGVSFHGYQLHANSGFSVSGAGDFNGDGFDDILIGAPYHDAITSDTGQVYLVFGKASFNSGAFVLNTLNVDSGVIFNGIAAFDYAGWSVSRAGDFNNDGFDDIVIGAHLADGDAVNSGQAYVVFGRARFGIASFGLHSLDGSNGFIINGAVAHDECGKAVSGGGDVNGDGFDDIIVSASYADPGGKTDSGEIYVLYGKASVASGFLRINQLKASDGFTLNGFNQPPVGYNYYQSFYAGDVNGDGRADIIIGDRWADPYLKTNAGAAYVVLSVPTGTLNGELRSINGPKGFTLMGYYPSQALGSAVANAGDFNGDGFDDVIVGANKASPLGRPEAGETYIIFGKEGASFDSLTSSEFDGSNGFRIVGVKAYDESGFSVSSAGDINDDGFDDLLVGVINDDFNANEAGSVYILFGAASFSSGEYQIDKMNKVRLNGETGGDRCGFSVSAGGDINGDGIDDIIVSALYARPSGRTNAGKSYVVFGRKTFPNDVMELSGLDGSNGITLNGVDVGDGSGYAVSGAGDFNGDGFDDIIIGAPWGDVDGVFDSGEAYVVFGKAFFTSRTVELAGLDGSTGIVLHGTAAVSNLFGASVAGIGDINGDGFDDIIVGAYLNDRGLGDSGAAFVFFGKASFTSNTLTVTALDGSNGFVIPGIAAGDNLGRSVSGAGDVNGDGLADFIVGAPWADADGVFDAGQAYVVFGRATFPAVFSVASLDGDSGYIMNGHLVSDVVGQVVGGGGDVNGDGFSDVIVGSQLADANGAPDAGKTYVIYGDSKCELGEYTLVGSPLCFPVDAGCWGLGVRDELSSCPNLCPPGTFSTGGAGVCTPCPLGTSSLAVGATSLDMCVSCPVGSYTADTGSATCSTCSPTQCTVEQGCYWTSDTANFDSCTCTGDYVGSDCEVLPCAPVMKGISLSALVFLADPQLRRYSATYNITSEQPKDALSYLKNLVKVQIDVNGDGVITREEVIDNLLVRSVRSANLSVALPLWCENAQTNSSCVWAEILTLDLINEAYANFVNSPEHTFDGSGALAVSNMMSTYPTPDWSDSECASYDSFQTPNDYNRVTTTWAMNSSSEPYPLLQVCGYVNGLASTEFTTTELLSGLATRFQDFVPVSPDFGFKRVYCLQLQYSSGEGETFTRFECSVGLFFDGTPIDLKPKLTADGIVFSYFDTSISEVEIDIFVGDLGSTSASKELAAGIPFPSVGCGRTAQHISFTDTQNKNLVGQVKEYAVHAIQMKNGKQYLSNMTLAPYRIPFFIAVDGVVETDTGNGVEGVRVDFCHIDAKTGKENTNPDFCPLISLYTDKRGHFEGEIRVSDPTWTNLVEYFNVTASLAEEITLDGETVVMAHEFSPSSILVSMQHKTSRSSIRIIDSTAVTLFGSVMIDPNIVGGNNCSFQGVKVEMTNSKGIVQDTVSDKNGSFTFSMTRGETVTVRIPEFRGHTWSSSLVTLNSGESESTVPTFSRRLLQIEENQDVHEQRFLQSAKPDVTDLLTGVSLTSDYWMETGVVVAGDQEWVTVTTTVAFEGAFSVFLSTPKTSAGDDRVMISARLRNVKIVGTLAQFETKLFQANETFCSKKWHVPIPIEPTEIMWIVVKQGAFELSNNAFFVGHLQVGRRSRNLKKSHNLFFSAFPAGLEFALSAVVGVVAQVQTLENTGLVVPRLAGVTTKSVIFTLSPPATTNTSIYPLKIERVAYMAYSLTQPMECSEFLSLEARMMPFNDVRKNIRFMSNFGVPPGVFGLSTVDFSAQDTATVRVEDVTTSGAGVMLQEDQCGSEETSTTLSLAYVLVIGENHNPTGDLRCGIKTTVLFPTSEPTLHPSMAPSHPTSVPTTSVPTRQPVSSAPSIEPTYSVPVETPTAIPSVSAMPTVTFSPTFTPETVVITASSNATQVLMAFDFDTFSFVEGRTVVTDKVNGLIASLHGVEVSNGDAMFDSSSGSMSYIQLPVAPLGRITVATIEIWATFNDDHDPLSTLFSFGSEIDGVNLLADFTGQRRVYIAIVFDAIAGEYKLYKNANLVEVGAFGPAFVFSNLRVNDHMGFIGRGPNQASASAHRMSAAVHDFRVTYGALSRKAIYSQYRVGGNPDMITLPGTDTMADVHVEFHATTKQLVEIGMYGGTTHAGGQRLGGLEMFGSETKFKVEATDYLCDYNFEVALPRDGSPIRLNLAAINYSVTVIESVGSAPQYSEEAANLFQPSSPFFCDESKPPLQYFKDANLLNQSVEIVIPTSTYVECNFTYISGVCMTVKGSDDFSEKSGLLDMVVGESCFDKDVTMMQTGVTKNVEIYVYERYPVENHWVDSSSFLVDRPEDEYTAYDIEPMVQPSSLTIYDLVSGFNSPQVVDYNSSVDFAGPKSRVKTPVGVKYEIKAGDPLVSPPYSWKFRVVASRSGVDGFSTAEAEWFIPVIGVLGKEVPNMYPVASDPNLIFMVLRDPPGGGSQSTIHAGTSFTMGMSIDDMTTTHMSLGSGIGASVGFQLTMGTWFGLGGGAAINQDLLDISLETKALANLAMSTERVSSTHYEYTFTFEYDFSTSADPNLAGHPSDVIIGGGLDLIVSEAIKVFVNETSSPEGFKCLTNEFTFQWHPGKVTTFALPVYEIEELIAKLSLLAKRDATNRKDITKEVENWRKVLSNYRDHTDTADVFTVEDAQLLYFVNKFHTVDNSFHPMMRRQLGLNPDTPFTTIMDKFYGKCKNSVLHVCQEFHPSRWESVGTFMMGYCNQPNLMMGSEYLLDSVCRKGQKTNPSLIKGPIDGENGHSLFGFLQDSSKTLTFGANAPLSISWTSSVGDDVANSVVNSVMTEAGASLEGKLGVTIFEVVSSMEALAGHTMTLGHNYESGHSLDRTVTITLDDSDYGDYFAVEILEDSKYGTPIFRTIGGQSKCPGETMTSRRESAVRIVEIIPRCGPYRNQECTGETAPGPGEDALFGVVVQNLSPTEDLVYYTLSASSSFDKHFATSYQSRGNGACGSPGQRAGLSFSFMAEDLGEIPFNELVEVPFAVTSMGICDSYNEISVSIIASCEMPSPNSQVFQYGVKTNDEGVQSVSYSLDDRLYASNSSATFNVEWASRRRLQNEDSTGIAAAIMELQAQNMELSDELRSNMMFFTAVLSATAIVVVVGGFGMLYALLKKSKMKESSQAIV